MADAPFFVLAPFTLVVSSRLSNIVKQDIVTRLEDKEIRYNLFEN